MLKLSLHDGLSHRGIAQRLEKKLWRVTLDLKSLEEQLDDIGKQIDKIIERWR
jgi:hypothetical protein